MHVNSTSVGLNASEASERNLCGLWVTSNLFSKHLYSKIRLRIFARVLNF
jgi:hypothetical protein